MVAGWVGQWVWLCTPQEKKPSGGSSIWARTSRLEPALCPYVSSLRQKDIFVMSLPQLEQPLREDTMEWLSIAVGWQGLEGQRGRKGGPRWVSDQASEGQREDTVRSKLVIGYLSWRGKIGQGNLYCCQTARQACFRRPDTSLVGQGRPCSAQHHSLQEVLVPWRFTLLPSWRAWLWVVQEVRCGNWLLEVLVWDHPQCLSVTFWLIFHMLLIRFGPRSQMLSCFITYSCCPDFSLLQKTDVCMYVCTLTLSSLTAFHLQIALPSCFFSFKINGTPATHVIHGSVHSMGRNCSHVYRCSSLIWQMCIVIHLVSFNFSVVYNTCQAHLTIS